MIAVPLRNKLPATFRSALMPGTISSVHLSAIYTVIKHCCSRAQQWLRVASRPLITTSVETALYPPLTLKRKNDRTETTKVCGGRALWCKCIKYLHKHREGLIPRFQSAQKRQNMSFEKGNLAIQLYEVKNVLLSNLQSG